MSGIPACGGFFVLVDMGRGRATPVETVERIKATYAMVGSIAETARDLNLPESTVRKYVSPEVHAEFAELRAQKLAEVIPDIVDEIAQTRLALIRAMRDPGKIAEADIRDLATAFGITADKYQLVTGQPTARNHNVNEERDPASILTPEELEQMAQLRERLASGMAG